MASIADQLQSLVARMLRPVRTRIYLLISRAVIESSKDDKGLQLLKLNLLAGESRDGVEKIQNFGFTSRPPVGSEALAFSVGGNREHLVVLGADDRKSRFKNLEVGECAVYTSDGSVVHLKLDGVVEVKAASKVLVECPEVEMSGNVKVSGNLQVDGASTLTGAVAAGAAVAAAGPVSGSVIASAATDLDSLKEAYNDHTHNENGDGGGVTDGPSETV